MNTGVLYLIATPIGNLGDISHRAVALLGSVDLVAAEDTRHSARLFQRYAIKTKKVSLHRHNEGQQGQQLIQMLKEGRSIALISDAGTPLVSDPGYPLVCAAHHNNIRVSPIPGPCAAIAALCASGLPADRFVFEGFLPAKTTQRKNRLTQLVGEERTLIFYEAPHRILAMLMDLRDIFGGDRPITLARELTKRFETIRRGMLDELLPWVEANPEQQKGEFVVLVQGAEEELRGENEAREVLALLLPHMSLKEAAKIASTITGYSKNRLYEMGLSF